jgi:hypothetical protein
LRARFEVEGDVLRGVRRRGARGDGDAPHRADGSAGDGRGGKRREQEDSDECVANIPYQSAAQRSGPSLRYRDPWRVYAVSWPRQAYKLHNLIAN